MARACEPAERGGCRGGRRHPEHRRHGRPDTGGRQDLVDKEQAELAILETYLPEQLSRDDILAKVKALIAEIGAEGPQQKGKVMGPLMAELRGKADGRLVNEVVDELLSAE